MNLNEAMRRLRAHEDELRQLGVEGLFVFGSMVRGEETETSDVDLFFDYVEGKLGLYELMDVRDYATEVLGCNADILSRDSLHRALRPKIENSAIRVF